MVDTPSYTRRFAALMADWILCLLISGLFARPMVDGWAPVLVLIVAYTFFIGLFGQTPGMRLLGLTCLSYDNGQPVGIPRAFVRAVLLALAVPALINDSEKRGLHDRASGTLIRRYDPAISKA